MREFNFCALLFFFSMSHFALAESLKKIGMRRNEAMLTCYKSIRGYHAEAVTRSTYAKLLQKAIGGSDYAHKLLHGDNQYLVLPASRNGQGGFYLVSDRSSTWVTLSPSKPLPTDQSAVVMPTDCFRFKDDENVGGEVYVTFMNYGKTVTNPGAIYAQRPQDLKCQDAKFLALLDADFARSFKEDLISRIDDVGRVAAKYKQVLSGQRSVGNKKLKEAASKPVEIEKALDNCASILDPKNDREVLAKIEAVKLSIVHPESRDGKSDLQEGVK